METALIPTVFGMLVIGRLYVCQMLTDFIASLPADERARVQRSLLRGNC